VLRAPELDTGLPGRSHQSGAEVQNPLPQPAGHVAFDAAQGMAGLLGCEHIIARLCPTYQYQPVLILGIAPTQVQDPALGLVEPHEVYLSPLLKPVQVPLDGIPSLQHINCATQLGVIHKLVEGALNPAVNIIDEDMK